MGRPPLEIGTYGRVNAWEDSGKWIARTHYRFYDGKTRPVKRSGTTKNKAINNLKIAIKEISDSVRGSITPDTKIKVIAEKWREELADDVAHGEISPNTKRLYEGYLKNHVEPALGELTARECTVERVNKFLRDLRNSSSDSTAKSCRSTVSGLLGFAARNGAIDSNPTRDAKRITVEGAETRALTDEEREAWLTALREDEAAVGHDLPDLTEAMLATGVRIGEMLAVSWEEVDLQAGEVDVFNKIVRVKGHGLQRISTTKSGKKGERLIPLPSWGVSLLRRRKLATGGRGPVFPDSLGGWRDPSNTSRAIREARRRITKKTGRDWEWMRSHVWRKTTTNQMREAGVPEQDIMIHHGWSRPATMHKHYTDRRRGSKRAAEALERHPEVAAPEAAAE